MNRNLKMALIDHPGPAWQFAKKANTSDSRLSKIVHGQTEPTEEEKRRFSEILGKPIPELFPEKSENGNIGVDS